MINPGHSDLDLKFIPNPMTKQVKNLDEKTAIIRALNHLFYTRQGEKLYDENFGIGIQDQLFEMNNFLTKDVLKTFIKTQINNYESRINVLNLELESDLHNLNIYLEYAIRSSPQERLVYQKTIRRIR